MLKSETVGSAYTRLIQWSGPALVSASFFALTLWTWRKWPDILVDFGRELYVPWQLASGKVLYTDIAYFNGPLSPYLNSVWFRLFGVSLTTLIFANLAILAAIIFITYRIFTDACNRFTGTMVSLVFVCVFAFSQYTYTGNYNFVSPYSHELTHGILFAVAMILCLSHYAVSRQAPMMLCAGLLLGLVFLTKAEVFLAAASAAALAFLLLQISGRPHGTHIRLASLVFLGGTLLPIASFFVFLSMQMPTTQALQHLAGTWTSLLSTNVASGPFYQFSMGIDHAGPNLAMMTRVFFGTVLLAGGLALADHARAVQKHRIVLIGASIFLLAATLLVKQWQEPWARVPWWPPVPLLLIGWPLPFVVLISGATLIVVCLKPHTEQQTIARLLPLAMWAGFAFVMLGKIILYPRLYQYGFALAMPATLMLVACFVRLIPQALGTSYGGGDLFRRWAAAMVIIDLLVYLGFSGIVYSLKDLSVGRGGDTIVTYGLRIRANEFAAAQALERIESLVAINSTFVVLPEGVMLNYLSRRSNPTPYVNFMPPEIAIYGEASIVNSFEAHPPVFVLLVHKDTSEYGVGYFGADPRYGRRIIDWVNSHYTTVDRILDEPLKGKGFGIEIRKWRY